MLEPNCSPGAGFAAGCCNLLCVAECERGDSPVSWSLTSIGRLRRRALFAGRARGCSSLGHLARRQTSPGLVPPATAIAFGAGRGRRIARWRSRMRPTELPARRCPARWPSLRPRRAGNDDGGDGQQSQAATTREQTARTDEKQLERLQFSSCCSRRTLSKCTFASKTSGKGHHIEVRPRRRFRSSEGAQIKIRARRSKAGTGKD